MGPPALFLMCIGSSLTLVRVTVLQSEDPVRISIHLPRAGSAPLIPLMLCRREFTLDQIYRVDVVLRPNPAAIGGFERLYHLRTKVGDYYFNSRWFSIREEHPIRDKAPRGPAPGLGSTCC